MISRMLVARRATLSRLGAWSGKSIVIRSSTASGISRMVNRDTTRETETAMANVRKVAGQRDIRPLSQGETSRAATLPATIGVPYASSRSPIDNNGRDRQLTSVATACVVTVLPPFVSTGPTIRADVCG